MKEYSLKSSSNLDSNGKKAWMEEIAQQSHMETLSLEGKQPYGETCENCPEICTCHIELTSPYFSNCTKEDKRGALIVKVL